MNIQEVWVQESLEEYYRERGYRVIREVKTDVGYIDLVISNEREKYIIEVKERSSIKHAIGQVLSYREFYRDCRLRVVYFSRDGKHRKIDKSLINNRYGIEIESINNIVDINRVIERGESKCQDIEDLQERQHLSMKEENWTYLNKQIEQLQMQKLLERKTYQLEW